MLDVIIALLPALIVSIMMFGSRAAVLAGLCVASCVFFEWAFEKILTKKNTINDLTAVITGLLVAFCLPVTIPFWQAVFGSFVAIIVVKQLFGGLGKNFANPAVTARVVMLVAFPTTMMATGSIIAVDAITGATPLLDIVNGDIEVLEGLWYLFLGVHGACLGDTSWLALLIGGLYLLIRRVITVHAPLAFIATVFLLTALFDADPVQQVFSGGLFLGAIFMATDYVTTPLTKSGRLIFGIGAGLFTVIIRLYGSYPEGVPFAILLMNMIVPYINKLTARKALGGVKV